MPEHYGIDLFVQFEHDAAEKAESLRARGLTVEMDAFAGGYGLAISGPAAAMDALYRQVAAERQSQEGLVLTGTVRWLEGREGIRTYHRRRRLHLLLPLLCTADGGLQDTARGPAGRVRAH